MDKDVDKRVEWLQSERHSASGNIFGEPQKTTRVGDEYQAKIPSLMTENERFQLMKIPVCEFGLPNLHSQHKNKEETDNKGVSNVHFLSSKETWSAIEHDSFVLGLYIFGKNLRVVNQFIGNKGMPHVITYYYGKFYRSSEHQKWSKYRKQRISMSVPGKKIFKGWRLQELLSRLPSNVTDECKASLTQVIKMFEEGKLSFEKYVFTLRDLMGLNVLVQAIAVGKRKQDLAITRKSRLRSKKVESACPSIETEDIKTEDIKTEEIINILKDRVGLSKGRLNEFFWTDVWPRLFARGWHYEQARNYALQNSTNLVFLAPGVATFSRRSLVKGSQYFDSLTEVLNKVASEPHLLEHEPDKDRLVEPHATQGSDEEQELMKCTVVDTSLVGIVKVTDLSSLTVFEPASKHASSSDCGETEHKTSEESKNEDVNQNKVVNSPDPDTKMNHSRDEQPVRKLKLVFKRKAKGQTVTSIKIENISGEYEAMEDAACLEKKPNRIVIDLNDPRVDLHSDDGNKSCSAKPSVVSETSTKCDLLTFTSGQRQSRRNRALTTKALEALENEFLNPKKKRRDPEDGTRKRVRAKMRDVSSCGARYLVDGVFNGSTHMVTESPK